MENKKKVNLTVEGSAQRVGVYYRNIGEDGANHKEECPGLSLEYGIR